MITTPNIAFDGLGNPAEMDSTGTNFNFLSVYLTGAWRSNLNINVYGYGGANSKLFYYTTVIVSATNPTLFTFNYMDIDRLVFSPEPSGQDAGFGYANSDGFVMDNFTFEFIPEPSSFLLAALGAVSLAVFLRRKRA
jgi:hypothetical protein